MITATTEKAGTELQLDAGQNSPNNPQQEAGTMNDSTTVPPATDNNDCPPWCAEVGQHDEHQSTPVAWSRRAGHLEVAMVGNELVVTVANSNGHGSAWVDLTRPQAQQLADTITSLLAVTR